jgi:hypothetical protein
MLKTLKIWFLILPLFFLSTKCETGGYKIPYARVDLHLNIISELGNPSLNTHTLIDGGVNGLIVFREDFDLFHVYDRTCTLYPEHIEAVAPDSTFDGVFTCPECNSRFLLLTGAEPLDGPATFPLHEYFSRVEGDLLHVYN